MKSFLQKTHITRQHEIIEREFCVYLTFSISLFTSFNRQDVMLVCGSQDNKSYLRDTNETIFASRWRVFIKKTQITEQHGITEREYFVFSRFHFHYSPHSTDRKWCLFAIRKISKAIFATPTKQFLLADEEFSSETHITQQHGITECEYCVYLTFSFSIFTSFNRQEAMFVSDSKDNKSYLCDINETIFASRWSFHQKNPNNWATWKYGTWVLRLSHVFIFIIHLIQQTGSDVCLRFKR